MKIKKNEAKRDHRSVFIEATSQHLRSARTGSAMGRVDGLVPVFRPVWAGNYQPVT